eukprot:TRINITY_DN7258_c0_g1_i1.p1 TRINITY_DN7258_c0_g1~~TRINITY_DN7258_c0_g1_i1.p1  ORF type:complete len:265 (+),score=73.12 TRINITY_DN7258_c0_g1_i1:55-849(+)
MKETLVNKYGEVLVGIYTSSIIPSDNVVLICHGLGGHKDACFYPKLADELASIGINSYRFDFAGNGESQGKFVYADYMKEVEDITSVKEHFTGLGKTVVAVVGHSKGAGVVLLYAAKHDDIPLVVSVAARYHMKEGESYKKAKEEIQQKGYSEFKMKQYDGKEVVKKVTQADIDERDSINMAIICASEKSKICVIHGTEDKAIPFEDSKSIYKKLTEMRAPTKQTHISILHADHNFDKHDDMMELCRQVCSWLSSSIQTLPPSK